MLDDAGVGQHSSHRAGRGAFGNLDEDLALEGSYRVALEISDRNRGGNGHDQQRRQRFQEPHALNNSRPENPDSTAAETRTKADPPRGRASRYGIRSSAGRGTRRRWTPAHPTT